MPTTNTVKATLRAISSPLTNSQARPIIEYSKQDLITLKHKHVNLTGLPAGTISTIRRLKLNRKKIRKAKHWKQFKQTGVNFHNLHQVQAVNQNEDEIVSAVRIAHVNARSIKNKDDLIAEYIDSAQKDCTIITETCLQDNEIDQGWVLTTTLINSNYKISTENHKTGKGGGIALVTSGKYYVKKLNKDIT